MQMREISGKEDSFVWGICAFGDQVFLFGIRNKLSFKEKNSEKKRGHKT